MSAADKDKGEGYGSTALTGRSARIQQVVAERQRHRDALAAFAPALEQIGQ